MKRLDHKLDNVTNIIAGCVVLHNICELMGDECQEEWIDTTLETGRLEEAMPPALLALLQEQLGMH